MKTKGIEVHEYVKPRPSLPLFGLRKLLSRYRRWHANQVRLNRNRIEQDARRYHGHVTWND